MRVLCIKDSWYNSDGTPSNEPAPKFNDEDIVISENDCNISGCNCGKRYYKLGRFGEDLQYSVSCFVSLDGPDEKELIEERERVAVKKLVAAGDDGEPWMPFEEYKKLVEWDPKFLNPNKFFNYCRIIDLV